MILSDTLLPAEQDGALGLYSARNLALTTGKCAECAVAPQALWYFEKELIAVPAVAKPAEGYTKVANIPATIKRNHDMPPLIWLGSPQVIAQTKINENAKAVGEFANLLDGGSLFLVDKIPNNLSYWDDSTFKFFQQRPIRLRGEMTSRGFEARTVWPLDYKLPEKATVKPLQANESLKSLVQFENGGAKSAYQARLLWAKNDQVAQLSADKTVIGFMLNGAQGDDDEAHGGHFAVVTGRMEADGNYARWLVNNYYNLASNSEKGIIAAVTPMDKYMADLNSGQSYYRPSYMLVAVLKTDTIAKQFQTATNETFESFYRNEFLYDHSRENCTGISVDTLRKMSWDIPQRGVEGRLKAIAAYLYVAATEKSLTKGRAIYDYLTTETTRLLPAVAFDAIGHDLLQQVSNGGDMPQTTFGKQLRDEVEAIYFVRIPQIPSSRAFGQAPVYSFEQFMQQAPADRSQWKVVPTTPNLLPKALENADALEKQAQASPSLVPWPVALLFVSVFAALGWITRKIVSRKKLK
ncbi:MAG TPA: hypothetical protein PL131_01990 [Methylotenera sp.]|nr:hypothetical protein [Methylotenera sp.]HPH04617.1 hypothetical protein [Methylotenera sp.]HPN01610.1 hypothetical protein [Methylotenera sp.]